MISHRAAHDGYQTELVKTVLSKKLESIFPHVYDEIAAAFLEGVPCSGEGESISVGTLASTDKMQTGLRLMLIPSLGWSSVAPATECSSVCRYVVIPTGCRTTSRLPSSGFSMLQL